MRKTCESCGKEFEARDPRHKTCYDCFRASSSVGRSEIPLLSDYFDEKGNLTKDVFVETPKRIANILQHDRVSMKSVRSFYNKILQARERTRLKDFNSAKPVLYELYSEIDDKLNRNVKGFPRSLAVFLRHHLSLAEKNENMLEGFYKHLRAVISYLPR